MPVMRGLTWRFCACIEPTLPWNAWSVFTVCLCAVCCVPVCRCTVCLCAAVLSAIFLVCTAALLHLQNISHSACSALSSTAHSDAHTAGCLTAGLQEDAGVLSSMTEYQISMLWLLVSPTPCNPDPNSMLWLLLPPLLACSCTDE